MTAQLSVLLTTEGTYPYQEGGVSTWCDALIRNMPDVSFGIAGITAQPEHLPLYALPPNVANIVTIPLWGTIGVSESRPDLTWGGLRRLRSSARQPVTVARFTDLFKTLVADLIDEKLNTRRLSLTLRDLARLFATNDYDTLMRHPVTWQTMRALFEGQASAWADSTLGTPARPSLSDVAEALQILVRWLTPLAIPLPVSQISHATAAGIASLPAIVAKVERGTPFLLTEHGVYLRERLIAWTGSDASLCVKWFAFRVTRRLVELSFALADAIAPVSSWNGQWEQQLGAPPSRIEPIRNGVDPLRFVPQPMPSWDLPTMVWVGRIDPLKDLLTLIEAMALVRHELPLARILLFGKAPAGNESYEVACHARVAALGLEQTVLFQGFASSPNEAFAQGHLSVLSSISEALPFSVIEAMFCGRPVVGTAVGGVPEVLAEGGLLVPPRSPKDLARACLTLLRDPEACEALGVRARAHVEANFCLQHAISAYSDLYRRLSGLMVRYAERPAPAWVTQIPEDGAFEGFAD